MKPGETTRVTCNACNTEFDVTLEPKAKGDLQSARQMPAQKVQHCPFCRASEDELETDEED